MGEVKNELNAAGVMFIRLTESKPDSGGTAKRGGTMPTVLVM